MSPSQQAKSMGLKSLKQVTELTGVSKKTLYNWHKSKGSKNDKSRALRILMLGCVETIKGEG